MFERVSEMGVMVKMDMKKMFAHEQVKPYIDKARYGIEKESQRVDLSGRLVKTDHPEILSVRDDHPYIQRDFSETQMELITPVTETLDELFSYLAAIHDVAYRSMGEKEMLWPLSMPPELPEKEEEIVIAKFNHIEPVLYRESLARTYGRRKQMICGIHYNFEFHEAFIRALYQAQSEIKDYRQFKEEVYLKVTRNYLHYRWFITYFFGASPRSEKNFFVNERLPEAVRSIRNSKYGYTNSDEVRVSYRSLQTYLTDLTAMVEKGLLTAEKEFYSAIRLRGGNSVSALKDHGIHYVELRNIDLNPFEPYGISYEQAAFLHLFMIYMLWKDEGSDCDAWVHEGDLHNEIVALEHPLATTCFAAEALEMIEEMEQLVNTFNLSISEQTFARLREMVQDPSKTLAGRLFLESQKSSQTAAALRLAQAHYQRSWEKPYQLNGFADMELSTQAFIFDAMQQGVKVEILDRREQFIKLRFRDHVEYVKNGNMTSKDSYISALIMENKTVTKKILHEHGFRVPQGVEFSRAEEALEAYDRFKAKTIVVKPKTTNYGIGVAIFKEGATYEDYKKAVNLAFQEDSTILVEEYLHGTEYRFFVIDDKVHAVLLRVPANVVGDGNRTIEELVMEKNRDPLRGRDHRTPLEEIQLGDIETLMLKSQGYEKESVPPQGDIVYLRENSNISTGGDSIDVTDEIPEDYKKIAVEAVAALGVKICGIDLIIENTEVPAATENAYGIIEANFNPAMYMHIFPYKGKSRRLTRQIIHYLFPELVQNA